jgi:PIN domain nuclease of toxin-antitoxin system
MKYLLDTHVLLWALFEPARISSRARKTIENPENDVRVSTLSFWEVALKYQVGKLELKNCVPDDLPTQIERMGIEILPMNAVLLASSYRLPLDAHKDPFDRLLAWQAIQQNMVLITKDATLEGYRSAGLKTLW